MKETISLLLLALLAAFSSLSANSQSNCSQALSQNLVASRFRRIDDPQNPKNYRFKVPFEGANKPSIKRIDFFVDNFSKMTAEQREALKALLRQFQYIDFPTFHAQILLAFEQFLKTARPEEKLVVLLNHADTRTKARSNDWVLQIIEAAYPNIEFSTLDATTSREVGAKSLENLFRGIENPFEQVRFLVLDDASYSGEQASYLRQSVGEFCIQATLCRDGDSPLRVANIYAYMSDIAREAILDHSYSSIVFPSTEIFAPGKMPNVEEILANDSNLRKLIVEIVGSDHIRELKKCLTVFAHKRPDYISIFDFRFSIFDFRI